MLGPKEPPNATRCIGVFVGHAVWLLVMPSTILLHRYVGVSGPQRVVPCAEQTGGSS